MRTSYFHLDYSSHVFKNTVKLLEFGIGHLRSCQDSRIFCRKESKLGAREMVQLSGELVKLIEDSAVIHRTHKEAYKHSYIQFQGIQFLLLISMGTKHIHGTHRIHVCKIPICKIK